MISKNKQSVSKSFRFLLTIPVAFALLMLYSFTPPEKPTKAHHNSSGLQMTSNTISNILFLNITDEDTTELINHYPGGYPAWLNFIKNNYDPPKKAIDNNIQGMIFIQFTVSENGEVKDPIVIRGIDTACDKEALRVVLLMPKWRPLLKDGKAVSFQYTLPIRLKLAPPPPETDSVEVDDIAYLLVEHMPEFKGGFDAMQKYLIANIHYPAEAQEAGIQGTVFVQFVVGKTGKTSKVKILKGIGGWCDEEAIRLVKEMPNWIPGRQRGQAVSVSFQTSVRFGLNRPSH